MKINRKGHKISLPNFCLLHSGNLHRLLEIFEREVQAGFQVDLRSPSEKVFCPGDVGAALLGIVLGQRLVDDWTF